MNTPIQFNKIPWDKSTTGIAQKVHQEGNKIIRLVRFDEHFIEEDWCTKSHMGYVLEGTLHLNFPEIQQTYNKGDALMLGSDCKHKVVIPPGTFVELILFEDH